MSLMEGKSLLAKPRRGRRPNLTETQKAEIIRRYDPTLRNAAALAREMGVGYPSVLYAVRAAGSAEPARDEPRRRFRLRAPTRGGVVLGADHPAVAERRTLFPGRVADAGTALAVLKSGVHQRKLGDRVVKGRWAGMPIYTLTLEERATCSATCSQWRSCYGNNMPHPARLRHGAVLEARLPVELAALQARHPQGFVVRLHILGDFPTLAYARLWAGWLDAYPALHVFGYSAWKLDTPIGIFLRVLSGLRWDRFAVRFSGALAERAAIVVRDPAEAGGAIVCPAQTDRTACCGTCGLCWSTRRNIAFLQH